MPAGAEILSIQMQRGIVCMWAMVNPEAQNSPRCIEMFGTGANIPQGTLIKRRFLATVQDGTFVWHYFERI